MNKTQAIQSIKKVQIEASKLETSALITLFELDISIPLENLSISVNDSEKVFYFHNNTKLLNTNIKSKGNTYILCPIEANGFEYTSQGVLPTPLLRITVSDNGISTLTLLKNKIKLLGDLVGCKLTRRRTFAKFLSSSNFNNNNRPVDLDVDELAEFPSDIWYINRKSNENKNIIEYELNSILDLENIQLPIRTTRAKRCGFTYRGDGCVYEYDIRRNDEIHGDNTILPLQAPPIATEDDRLISEVINTNIIFIGKFQQGNTYNKGNSVYIESNGLKYYFVANQNNVSASPPNPTYWIADQCSKCLKGCGLRWNNPNINVSPLTRGELRYGGFYSLDRVK